MSTKQSRVSATKRQAAREERIKRERKQRGRLIIYIVGGVALIVLGIVALNYFTNKSTASKLPAVVQITPKARPMANRNSMGDPNAKVKIIEYSDFQCPYCKEFADNTLQSIIDNYIVTGKVYFTSRSMGNFVSQNIGGNDTESRDAAQAAYCAADQGKYWEFAEAAFANWQGEAVGSFSPARLKEIAQTLGLDMNQFNQCVSSNKYLDQVNQDNADGRAAGVTGTPSFVINGKLVTGALPFSEFQTEIETALQTAGN